MGENGTAKGSAHKPYIGSKPSFRRKDASSIWLRVAGVFS